MNTTNPMIKRLANWIDNLRTAAMNDECFSVAWFGDTKNSSFNIVGGWLEGFSADYDDLYYISKSEPRFAMCVKIAVNDGQYCPDFETLLMPEDDEGNVDDTCIALELDDDSEALAEWLFSEWERITEEYEGFEN